VCEQLNDNAYIILPSTKDIIGGKSLYPLPYEELDGFVLDTSIDRTLQYSPRDSDNVTIKRWINASRPSDSYSVDFLPSSCSDERAFKMKVVLSQHSVGLDRDFHSKFEMGSKVSPRFHVDTMFTLHFLICCFLFPPARNPGEKCRGIQKYNVSVACPGEEQGETAVRVGRKHLV
jgi:hypothetical protein